MRIVLLGSGNVATVLGRLFISSGHSIEQVYSRNMDHASTLASEFNAPFTNDFANLAPRKINFRMGGFITGIIGILIFPWKLIADPSGYIFTWLIAYSSLLGPVGGIMIADYYFINRQKLIVEDLYKHGGIYGYKNGFNTKAIVALLCGILPNVPGFLVTIKIISKDVFPLWINDLYNYAWFVGFFVSAILYILLMRSYRITKQKLMVETRHALSLQTKND